MSAGVTRAFLPTLRRLDGELTMSLPDRVNVLRELEADLEELTDRLVSIGHDVDAARRMALDALAPDGSTLGELTQVHAPAYTQLTRQVSGSRLRFLERSALLLATLGVIVLEAVALLGADLGRDPSPILWPVLGSSGVLFAAITAKVFTLWIKKDHRSAGDGVTGILVLSGLVPAVAFAGVMVDLYFLAGALERTPVTAPEVFLGWLGQAGAVLSVAMLASMMGGLTWFVLTQWLSALDAARAETLGLGRTHRIVNTTEGDDHE